ncbi:MAG: YgiQ family radical SAM protein, partial [Desulfatitalea sp.]
MPPRISMPEFMPTTAQECRRLGWSELDVVLVSGDVYLDAPHIGVAVIGRVLLNAGYRVGIIAQPDVHTARDITRLGEPRLFWGVSGGSVDSMIANYTASGRRRRSDDMTPGGVNDRRPDRAVLAYSHLIRRHFKQTRPIVLGGIEASLRRISHYDARSDAVRRSILFDAKADLLLYGMADQSVVALADKLAQGEDGHDLRGLCYIRRELPTPDPGFSAGDVLLPAHQEVCRDPAAFARMFALFYANADPLNARRLVQQQDTRYLVHNPPALAPSVAALDAVYELPYARAVHPYYRRQGPVAAMETIPFSLTTHRGCFGECRFCAIAVHQGRRVVSRSQ